MGKQKRRFVAKGVPGGWRIWNKIVKKWWGHHYEKQPDELVAELNGEKRQEVLNRLSRKLQNDKR